MVPLTAMIRFRVLGALDLRDSDGRAVHSVLAQPKRLALLAHLAVSSPERFHRRDRTLAIFWPDQDSAHARAALNRALYYLRHSLGDGIILSRGDEEIGLAGEGFWCDARAFEAAAMEGRHREAIDLYRGDLLESFYISDAPGFDRWLDSERARFRTLACRAGRALSQAQQAAGNLALAAHWERWSLERDPFDESAVQRLMRLLDGAGDRAGAIHAYEQFAHHIAAELELAPSPETRALVNAIRSRVRPAEGTAAPSGPGMRGARDDGVEPNAPRAIEEPDPSPVPGGPVASQPATVERAASPASSSWIAGPRRRRFARGLTRAGGVAGLMVVALVVMQTRRPAADANLIVVAPFENRAGDPALESLAGLATDGIVHGITDLMQALPPLGPAHGARVDSVREGGSDIRRIARSLRAGILISGAITRVADQVRVTARIFEASRDRVVWEIGPVYASTADPEPALREVQERLSGSLAALLNPRLASWFPLATAPPTLEAYEEFVSASELVGETLVSSSLASGAGHPREALAHYQRAALLDTTFTWALLETVDIHRVAFGDGPLADSILALVDAKRTGLPPLQLYWLDWLRMKYRDPIGAYRSIRAAAEIAPERFLHELAYSANIANRPRETLGVLQRIGRGDRRLRESAAYYGMMSDSYHRLREHRKEFEVVRRARRADPDALRTVSLEIRARAALGQSDRVLALLDTALALPRPPRSDAGSLMVGAARELRAHGQPAAASLALEQAIRWYLARPGAERNDVWNRWDLADALYLAGCWTHVRSQRLDLLARADSIFRGITFDAPPLAASIQGSLGAIAMHLGDRARVDSVIAGLKRFSDSERPPGEVFFAEARIKALMGDRDGAVRSLSEWVGGQGWDLHLDPDFDSLREHPAFLEFVRPKG